MMKSLACYLLVTVLLVACCASQAFATSCVGPSFDEAFARASSIFLGKAVNTEYTTDAMLAEFQKKNNIPADEKEALPDTFTDFEVLTQFKGVPEKKFRVFYNTGHRRKLNSNGNAMPVPRAIGDYDPPPFAVGEEKTISADYANGVFTVYRGICSYSLDGNPELQVIKEGYDALDELIRTHPVTPEFYIKKADLQEGRRDYASAALTYEKMLSALDTAKIDDTFKLAYGRNLYFAGRYDDALKILQPYNAQDKAIPYIQLSKLRLGRGDELKGQKLLMAGQEISDLSIQDVDVPGSDFSGAKLKKVKFINSKLPGADFSKSWLEVEVIDSDLTASKFENAKIHGKFTGSHFDRAIFGEARIDLREASLNSFNDADFTNARLQIAEASLEKRDGKWVPKERKGSDYSNAKFVNSNVAGLGKSKLTGAKFTGTDFYSGGTTSWANQELDLSGQNLDGRKLDNGDFTGSSFKNASLKGTTFTGANLTNVDFTGANLTGASLTVSRYRGATKLHNANFAAANIEGVNWEGAIYDCKTKFPEGFDAAKNGLEPVDSSCYKPSGAGIVIYSADRFERGRVNVCDGNFTAKCVYAFIINYAVNGPPDSPERHAYFDGVAASLISIGEYEPARLILMRAIAENGTVTARFQELLDNLSNKTAPDFSAIKGIYQGSLRRNPIWERRERIMEKFNGGNKQEAREMTIDALAKVFHVQDSIDTNYAAEIILTYADIIANTEERIDPKVFKELEPLIRTSPHNSGYKKNNNTSEPKDYVEAGEKIVRNASSKPAAPE